MIIDYSQARPSMSTLRNAGVTAVGRYIGWDGTAGNQDTNKNLTRQEAAELIGAGMSIFLAFEYLADAAAHGSIQGAADGKLASQQLAQLGAPPDMAVYFCVDYDMPDYSPGIPDTPANAKAKLGPVGSYFQTINEQHYPYEVGVYGGYWAVKRILDAGLASKSWQTAAWSGGRQDGRCDLYQLTQPSPISGTDIDTRVSINTSDYFGQWPRPGTVAVPPFIYLNTTQIGAIMSKLPVLTPPVSGKAPMNDKALGVDYIGRLQAILRHVYGYQGVPDNNGIYDAATVAGVKAIQVRYSLKADGICGPLTWMPIVTGVIA